jgi:hypothetical protein
MVGVVDCSAIQTTESIVELVHRVSLRHRTLLNGPRFYPDVTGLDSVPLHSKELSQVEGPRERCVFPSVIYNDKKSKLIT